MCGRTAGQVAVDCGITVIDNLLGVVNEVTRGLDIVGCSSSSIGEAQMRTRVLIIRRKSNLVPVVVQRLHTMLVLGIDVTAAQALHYIDEVKLNHTSDITPIGNTIGTLFCTFIDDFEIDT